MSGKRMLFGVLIVALLLVLAVGLGQAQVPEPPQGNAGAEGADPAAVSARIPIQGRLTDASGSPINGTRTVTFTLYDAANGGTAVCQSVNSVDMVDGQFSTWMANCTASDFNGVQLWLGIQVAGDPEMTPRQAIYPVPYAWALKPGAIVMGADSYVFEPGSAFVKNNDTDTTRWDVQVNGGARVYRGATAGAKYIFYPITLPGMLYGQNVTVKSITVYYVCQNGANNYITGTSVTKLTDADSYDSLAADSTDRTSTTATSYTLTLTGNNVLSSEQGVLGVYLTLAFANDTEYIQIGGVRLQLGHQ
jgi:hypothetical protein